MPVTLVKRLEDENDDTFFARVVSMAVTENKTYVIWIRTRLVDVTPETTVEYLMGARDMLTVGSC